MGWTAKWTLREAGVAMLVAAGVWLINEDCEQEEEEERQRQALQAISGEDEFGSLPTIMPPEVLMTPPPWMLAPPAGRSRWVAGGACQRTRHSWSGGDGRKFLRRNRHCAVLLLLPPELLMTPPPWMLAPASRPQPLGCMWGAAALPLQLGCR